MDSYSISIIRRESGVMSIAIEYQDTSYAPHNIPALYHNGEIVQLAMTRNTRGFVGLKTFFTVGELTATDIGIVSYNGNKPIFERVYLYQQRLQLNKDEYARFESSAVQIPQSKLLEFNPRIMPNTFDLLTAGVDAFPAINMEIASIQAALVDTYIDGRKACDLADSNLLNQYFYKLPILFNQLARGHSQNKPNAFSDFINNDLDIRGLE